MFKKTVMMLGLLAGTVPLAYGNILGTLDDIASASQAIRNISQESPPENVQPAPTNPPMTCPAGYTCMPKSQNQAPAPSANDNGIAPSLRNVPGSIALHSTPFPPGSQPQETTQEAADQAAAQKVEPELEALQPRVGNPVDRRFDAEVKAQAQGEDDNTPYNGG